MNRTLKWGGAAAVGTAGILLLALQTEAIDVQRLMFRQAIPTSYFERETRQPDRFEKIADRIYAFRHGFNRTMIVDSGDGLAVIDTFDARFVEALKKALARELPGKPVRWVFYSHNHLDHIRGAAGLDAQEIVAHEKVMEFVRDFPHAKDVVPPSRLVSGDQEMMLGAVRMQMLFLPNSHSQTLYAFYFPDTEVVFAPDLMFVHAFPPFGLPDWYYPGYIRALDRLADLNAEHYVPSHLDLGTKADFLRYRQMMRDFRETVVAGLEKRGLNAADSRVIRAVFDESYPQLKAKYGDWHGFNDMFLPHFVGQIGGTYLGY